MIFSPAAISLALLLLSILLTANITYLLHFTHQHSTSLLSSLYQPISQHDLHSHIPDVIIYRRTKKTASSSMLEALLIALRPYNYFALYNQSDVAKIIVRSESYRPLSQRRRLLIANHNSVAREDAVDQSVIIIDTVVEGYKQITSFCRFIQGITDCSDGMSKCIASPLTRAQQQYRWCQHRYENRSTYIDLPLSSAHPALSTTIFRRIFPKAVLDVPRYNVANSTCPESPQLREIYDVYYEELDQQVEMLRKRILTLAGYPTDVDGLSLTQIMDAAEKAESPKYDMGVWQNEELVGKNHLQIKWESKPKWRVGKDGALKKTSHR